MKKIVSFFCYAVLSMAAMVVFNSCDEEENDVILDGDNSSEETKTYVRLVASTSDNLFEYGDIVLTLKGKEINKECRLSKGTAIDSLAYEVFSGLDEEQYTGKVSGREVEIPAFECANDTLVVTTKFELSESGKQKIANAKAGEEENFAYVFKFGKCSKDGIFKSSGDGSEFFDGIEIAEFDAFMEITTEYFRGELVIK